MWTWIKRLLLRETAPAPPAEPRHFYRENPSAYLQRPSVKPDPKIAEQRNLLSPLTRLRYPILFFDTETTGVTSDDRVVSFGAVMLKDATGNPDGSMRLDLSTTHLIFNPERPSHPMARRVHGHTDHELSYQRPFADSLDEISGLFSDANLVVGHNIAFDLKFIEREFRLAAKLFPNKPSHCTMREAQQNPFFENGKLDTVLKRIGHSREGGDHGALEDAWLTMAAFMYMEVSIGATLPPFSVVTKRSFANYVQPLVPDPGASQELPDATHLTVVAVDDSTSAIGKMFGEIAILKAQRSMLLSQARKLAKFIANDGDDPQPQSVASLAHIREKSDALAAQITAANRDLRQAIKRTAC